MRAVAGWVAVWIGYAAFSAAVLSLAGCAALGTQRPERTLPVEIISELSDAGCEIQSFGYGRSPRQGERVTVQCASPKLEDHPQAEAWSAQRLISP